MSSEDSEKTNGISSDNLRRIALEIESAGSLENFRQWKETLSGCAKKLFEFSGLVNDARTLEEIVLVNRMLPDDIRACHYMKGKTLVRCVTGMADVAIQEKNKGLMLAASRVAEEITVESEKRAAAAVCAQSLIDGGMFEEDEKLTECLIEMAKIIAADAMYESQLYRVAEALAGTAVEKKNLDLACQAKKLIIMGPAGPAHSDSTRALAACAKALLSLGSYLKDVELIDAAEECAWYICDPDAKSEVLLLCAETLIRMGLNKAGTELFLESVRSAKKPGPKMFQAKRFSHHVRVLERLLTEPGEHSAHDEILKMLDQIKSIYLRSRILLCQAKVSAAGGREREALDTLEKVISMAERIIHDYDRAAIMRECNEILLKTGARQSVATLISKIQKLSRNLKHAYLKEQVLESCEKVLSEVVTNNKLKKIPSIFILLML